MATFSEKEGSDPGAPGLHFKVLECGVLRVAFDWRVDRYAHRLERRVDGEWCAIFESVEDSPDAEWPCSPVLQHLHIEDRASGKVALLVGKAAKSHWSASIEAEPSHGRFVFDVACRIADSPHWLGSAYRAIATELHRVDIAALPNEAIVEHASSEDLSQSRIRPVDFQAVWPRTIRWRYAIGIVE